MFMDRYAGASIALRRFRGSNHNQANSADQRQPARERRERDGLVGVGGGMDRADIGYRLAAGVGDPLIRNSQGSEDDENDPNKGFIGLKLIKYFLRTQQERSIRLLGHLHLRYSVNMISFTSR